MSRTINHPAEPERARAPAWHSLAAPDVARALDVDAGVGLSASETARRLREHGPNLLPQARPPGALAIFAGQFRSVLIYVLLAAAIVSVVVGDELEAGAIAAIVFLNALLGFVQEYRAERAVQALKSMVSPEATVLRDGSSVRIPLSDVVPGDVLLLEAGDVIAADARILEANGLRTSEALLTGESTPVDKQPGPVAEDTDLAERQSMVYQGTHVANGRGQALAVATGAETEMGRIASLIAGGGREETPLQRRLAEVGRYLVFGALALCALVFVIGIARGIETEDMFLTAASLAVAAIPEGLPAATTIVLALGVQRMARRRVIVRRMPAVETLGSVTVIYSDKTGTLTENRMRVRDLWAPRDEAAALRVAVLCNNASLGASEGEDAGDPTETALLRFASEPGVDLSDLRARYPRQSELPFDASRSRMSVVVRTPEGRLLGLTKGAPEVMLERCSGPTDLLADASERATEAASSGMRVLALAQRELSEDDVGGDYEREMELLGLVAMADPLRSEAREAIETAAAAGVRTVMLTGDHPSTAAAIGSQLGLAGRAVTGREIAEGGDPAAAEVFARVTSEDKLRIVRAARERGDIVAMTGDGVNDAPALRAADIGVAMGLGGTDVSREASDMVLLDNNFRSIVAAIEEGRAIFANIRRFVHFLLSCNIGELLVVFLALTVAGESPLRPLQLLFVNLLTDGLPALALGVEPPPPDIMSRPPRSRASGILSARSLAPVLGIGSLVAAATLLALFVGHQWSGTKTGHEMAFATLVCSQLAASLVFRSEEAPLRSLGRNGWLAAAILSSVGLLAVVFAALPLRSAFDLRTLSLEQWLVVGGLSLLPLVVGELLKVTGLVRRFGLAPA